MFLQPFFEQEKRLRLFMFALNNLCVCWLGIFFLPPPVRERTMGTVNITCSPAQVTEGKDINQSFRHTNSPHLTDGRLQLQKAGHAERESRQFTRQREIEEAKKEEEEEEEEKRRPEADALRLLWLFLLLLFPASLTCLLDKQFDRRRHQFSGLRMNERQKQNSTVLRRGE